MSNIKFTKKALIKTMENYKKKLPMEFDGCEVYNVIDVKIEENCLVGILDCGMEFNIIHSSDVIEE